MMPSLKEIVFSCPLCAGPLIAWETDAGRTTDCPHCLKPLSIPIEDVVVVNKETFNEPSGLRRILQEVRDSEWESLRRKLQETRARVATLEAELRELRAEKALAAGVARGSGCAGLEHLKAPSGELAHQTARSEAAALNPIALFS